MSVQASTKPSYKIMVISEILHKIAEAREVLSGPEYEVSYVVPFRQIHEITSEQVKFPLAETDALIIGGVRIDAEVLDKAKNLKVISIHRSGCDNIDVDTATERGIFVTTVRGVNAEQCADFTMGLIIALVRQILTGDKAIRAGKWNSKTEVSPGVSDSTLGIVGVGNIGEAVARRAMGFNMRILATKRHPSDNLARRYGLKFVQLDDLLREADIVTLNVPLSSQTKGMIGERELHLMKDTAFLINISRGEIVDEEALYTALKDGWIKGAALDAYAEEPLYTSPLFELENIIVTPHQAGLTESSIIGAAIRTARNALSVLKGEMTSDVVNPEAVSGPSGKRR